ncbi:MAG TPA: ATP-binding protein [Bryobacteraceae bacterium]|jgi:DNA polymerase III delta prime subunit|nr:ATP-binding protein [Bryobacteraceae bacterium]
MNLQFKRAVKYGAKGRLALIGPSGSGKSMSALKAARRLAGPNGRVACIDTEHGSLSKYADLFEFDVIELNNYSPENFFAAFDAAEQAGYDVIVIDSMSHFWMGAGGALEYVDMARKRSGSRDDMAGWKDFRPVERQMLERMIGSPMHVIVTMRTKTAYEEQINERTGKKQRVKIGLAPVQREGLEYEFDFVGLMNEDNELITDKTRCPAYAGKVIAKPSEKDFDAFAEWLKGEERAQAPAAAPIEHPQPSAKPAPASAPAAAANSEVPELVQDLWKQMSDKPGFARVFGGFLQTFQRLLGEEAGNEAFNQVLGLHGVDSWQHFKGMQAARRCVLALYNKALELSEGSQLDLYAESVSERGAA